MNCCADRIGSDAGTPACNSAFFAGRSARITNIPSHQQKIMVTSGFHIHPALLMPLIILSGSAGAWLIGTGLYDLFVDRETVEMFAKGRGILISAQTDPDRFDAHVCYRLFLGVVCIAIACILYRMRRWIKEV